MENTEARNEDQQCCEEVDPRAAQTERYGELLVKCFDVAMTVMEKHEMLEGMLDGEGIDRELQTQIAMVIFNRCTREQPQYAQIFELALEYLHGMMKAQEEDRERIANLPPMPRFGATISVSECEHPGLRLLHKYWIAGDDESGGTEGACHMTADSIIKASSFESDYASGEDEGPRMSLLCPHCRAIFPMTKVMSGELWEDDEEEEAEEEKAEEDEEIEDIKSALEYVARTPRGKAILEGMEKFLEVFPLPEGAVPDSEAVEDVPKPETDKVFVILNEPGMPSQVAEIEEDSERFGEAVLSLERSGGSIVVKRLSKSPDSGFYMPEAVLETLTVQTCMVYMDFPASVKHRYGEGRYALTLYDGQGQRVDRFFFKFPESQTGATDARRLDKEDGQRRSIEKAGGFAVDGRGIQIPVDDRDVEVEREELAAEPKNVHEAAMGKPRQGEVFPARRGIAPPSGAVVVIADGSEAMASVYGRLKEELLAVEEAGGGQVTVTRYVKAPDSLEFEQPPEVITSAFVSDAVQSEDYPVAIGDEYGPGIYCFTIYEGLPGAVQDYHSRHFVKVGPADGPVESSDTNAENLDRLREAVEEVFGAGGGSVSVRKFPTEPGGSVQMGNMDVAQIRVDDTLLYTIAGLYGEGKYTLTVWDIINHQHSDHSFRIVGDTK